MKTYSYFLLLVIILSFSYCNHEVTKEERQSNITNLEAIPFIDTVTFEINEKHSNDLVNAYAEFAEAYPEDEQTPEYLFRAAEISRSTKSPQKAIDLYQKLVEKYEKYEKTPYCQFLIGFTYDNDLKDMFKAKENYTLFIDKYPDHDFVKDAKVLLENLGKSPEELIKSFEEKNQAALDSI